VIQLIGRFSELWLLPTEAAFILGFFYLDVVAQAFTFASHGIAGEV
jgi:hypothetical protein